MSTGLSACTTADTGVHAILDGAPRFFSWTWLRDHATDDDSYHSGTEQRLVPPAVVAGAGPAEVAIDGSGRALLVTWPDGPTARFPSELLATVTAAPPIHDLLAAAHVPWNADALPARFTRVPFEQLDDGATALQILLQGIARDGVALVDDVPTHIDRTREVLEQIGYIRSTIFGGMWEFGSDGALDDTASTGLEITLHTDGTYSHDAPGLLALHCLEYDAVGGENVLVDGACVAAQLEATDPAAGMALRTVEIPARYIGNGAHLVARRPVLRVEDGRLIQISYNHHDRAPFWLPEPEMARLYAALHLFDEIITRPEYRVELALRPGDMLLIDNWRVLHGRHAFNGQRRMAGGYLNREDIESRIRTLSN